MASLPYACRNITSLRSWLAEFDAEFDVCALLHFQVHADVANVTEQGVTKTRVVQLPMFTQRSQLAEWVATLPALNHSKNIQVVPSVGGLCELVYELFDPPRTYGNV
jgi:hypothetical protein